MQQAVVDGGAALIAALIAIGGTLVLIQLVAMAVRWVSGEVGGSPPITPTSSMPMVSDGNGTKPASDTATSTDQVSEFSPREGVPAANRPGSKRNMATAIDLSPLTGAVDGTVITSAILAVGGVLILPRLAKMAIRWVKGSVN